MWILVIIAATSIGGPHDPRPFVSLFPFATERECREFSARPEWKSGSSDTRSQIGAPGRMDAGNEAVSRVRTMWVFFAPAAQIGQVMTSGIATSRMSSPLCIQPIRKPGIRPSGSAARVRPPSV
jgi:hypothetical protein